MRGKNESRRVSMEDYDAESAEYYGPSNSEGPRENIYLKNEAKKSVTQCFNIVRSKLTIESRMYKKGTTSKWHTTMKPFIDGTVVAEELIAFAEAVCGLESGSADASNYFGCDAASMNRSPNLGQHRFQLPVSVALGMYLLI